MGLPSLVRRRRRGIFAGSGIGGGAVGGASDDFNRADSPASLGTSSSGHLWTVHAGTGEITVNRAKAAVSPMYATVDAGIADGDFSINIPASFTGGEFPGVFYRAADASNGMIGCVDGTTGYLIKREAGANSTLASAVHGGFVDTDTVRVVVSGASHSLRKNTTEITTTTSSFQSTATLVGIHVLGAITLFDDFAAVP